MYPCKKPAAKRSPAPVRSIIFRSFCIPLLTTSSPLTATAPFSPLVTTINLLSCLENSITSLKFFALINELIYCSLAKVISSLFLTKFKKCSLCLSTQNKSESDIATLFALLIALSNAFLGSPSSHK